MDPKVLRSMLMGLASTSHVAVKLLLKLQTDSEESDDDINSSNAYDTSLFVVFTDMLTTMECHSWARETSTEWWDQIVLQVWDDEQWLQNFWMRKATFMGPGKAPGTPGWFVYLLRPQVQPIAAPTSRGSLLQTNGGCGKRCGPRDVLTALPTAPIGLELRTMVTGIHDQLNLQTRQKGPLRSCYTPVTCKVHAVAPPSGGKGYGSASGLRDMLTTAQPEGGSGYEIPLCRSCGK
ncbi:hypothetical protein UY3_01612 [Chelonia mydas]|uniref:Uncharacterized protein n=1 Tax=Chelonia mydas TaxID=8469 RepID=M7CJI6_CHEMY|nr:hypothetical protein UY3_01612 [Chelonia mydas]